MTLDFTQNTPQADQVLTVRRYLTADSHTPLFLAGDSLEVLSRWPASSIDMAMTSPPYWGHRKYEGGGIGLEEKWEEYVDALLRVFAQVKRVLKPTGSLWLNLGDTYRSKGLLGVPWRVAFALIDRQGWVLRNDVIWNKLKGGMDNAKDKLSNVHEYLFHFVKAPQDYYYDVDAIRNTAREARVVNGAVVSGTGVSGVRYRRQIELSTALTPEEKAAAYEVLENTLDQIRRGELSDFRMVIRGQQRATHSDSSQVSGRARELDERGFYILKYHPKGTKPGDVWDIIPEDTRRGHGHFAAYPPDLCRMPILSTCPPRGVVLDPFCGTGTTNLVALQLGRKSVGIDMSEDYLIVARERCHQLI